MLLKTAKNFTDYFHNTTQKYKKLLKIRKKLPKSLKIDY